MTLLVPAIIFLIMIVWLKGWEEPRLEQRFGQVYRDYKRHTPFLIPRFRPLMRELANSFLGAFRHQKTGFAQTGKTRHVHAPQAIHLPTGKGRRPKAKGEPPRPATSALPDDKTTRVFQHRLLRWYSQHGRDLPWRHTRDPYNILVSEMMLHQTQVDRVVPKYNEWVAVYPTFEALAAAPLEEVKQLWRPLGYNFRPERLHRIAQHAVTELDGTLPNTVEALMALPGIGRYTAGAIVSFAFHQDAPIVDTNVRRLIQRVFGVHGNPHASATEKAIWQLAEILIPHGQAFIFNQALIDFGALICTARNPACPRCVFKDLCKEKAGDTTDD
jgi:A/G-specific adenine glycosylase